MSVGVWNAQLESIIETIARKDETPVWYCGSESDPVGPFTEFDLLQKLQTVKNLSTVRVFRDGFSSWVRLFDLPDITEKLGIMRRENKRAPLNGTVSAARERAASRPLNLRAASISAAGMGLKGSHDLRSGERVSLHLRCLGLPTDVHLHGTVVYVSDSNYAGIRFDTVPAETQSYIVGYINNFVGHSSIAA